MHFFNKKKPHRNAAFVKNQSGSVTPKENELNIFIFILCQHLYSH